jgi:hypothetical protein
VNEIIATSDDGYLLAGSSRSGIGGDKTEVRRGLAPGQGYKPYNYWIVKISSAGTKQWAKTSDDERARANESGTFPAENRNYPRHTNPQVYQTISKTACFRLRSFQKSLGKL